LITKIETKIFTCNFGSATLEDYGNLRDNFEDILKYVS